MKAIGIIITFLIFTFQLYSQDKIVIKPTSLDLLISYEDSIGSISKGFQFFNPYYDEDFEDIYENWPNVLKKPLIYKRINDDFYPTLHAWYFYDKDSTVKWIDYHWGFGNTKIDATDDEIRQQTFREKDFKKKYKKEKENLKKMLGTPTIEDVKKETDSYLNLKTIWNLPEKRVVINMTIDKRVVEFYSKEVEKIIVIPRSKIEIKILMKEK
ncbi:MAG: hypothetical protein KAT68_08380 [Bacteroidales bacterium]|nr:hypothetical protein [Bacteroidales bacterium]